MEEKPACVCWRSEGCDWGRWQHIPDATQSAIAFLAVMKGRVEKV